jgi:hypothetical protein
MLSFGVLAMLSPVQASCSTRRADHGERLSRGVAVRVPRLFGGRAGGDTHGWLLAAVRVSISPTP